MWSTSSLAYRIRGDRNHRAPTPGLTNRTVTTIDVIGGLGWRTVERAFSAIEFDHRSELKIRDKDWGLRPFADNFDGGWSGTGMPGTTYLRNPNIPVAAGQLPGTNQQQFRGIDPQCVALGGDPVTGPAHFQFSFFDNLVEKTNTYKTLRRVQLRHQRHVEISRRGDVLVPGHAALELVARLSAELAVRSRSHHSRTTIRASIQYKADYPHSSRAWRRTRVPQPLPFPPARRSTTWRCINGRGYSV